MSKLGIGIVAVAAALSLVPAGLAAPASSGRAAASAAGTSISLGEYFFRPSAATVRVGVPVTFTNTGRIQHTVADATAKGRILARLIKPRPLSHGQHQTVVFHRPGLVRYLCTFHPTLMKGTIRVTP